MAQVDTDGNHSLFLNVQLAHLLTGNIHKKFSDIASYKDIIENNHVCYVMEFQHHLIFLQCSLAPLAVDQRAYVMACCLMCLCLSIHPSVR